jgi:hypothetical protein
MLRFSDAETSDPDKGTVALHNQIIASNSSTWWGWWKKITEPNQQELLAFLQNEARSSSGIRLGLINRKEDIKLYVAQCVDVEFSIRGSGQPSPNRELTPRYYNSQEFPAWFKFIKIEEVEKSRFEDEFGEIPSLDPTLYDVRWDNGWEIYPRSNWSMTPIEIRSSVILHLSDLHFGADHGFPTEHPLPGSGLDLAPLWQVISNHVTRRLNLQVGLVVVSGDLITKGDANAFAAVREFLTKLLNALRLDTQHLVMVPGNHDLWTQGIDHPTRTYSHQQPYISFVEGLLRAGFSGPDGFSGLERVRRYRTPSGNDLIFLELNSARIRSDALKEYGYVSKHRYEDLLKFVEGVLQDNPPPTGHAVRFAVLHHHVLPVGGVSIPEISRPVSLCLDAGELIDNFQTHGVNFVLHGHQHAPFVGMTARIPDMNDDTRTWLGEHNTVFVLGCGSSGVKRERLPMDVMGNVFGLYCVEEDRMRVSFIHYLPGVEPKPLWKMALPIHPNVPPRKRRARSDRPRSRGRRTKS